MKPKVMVAMSGGVDSSVAASLLLEQEYDVCGATLKLFTNEEIGLCRTRKPPFAKIVAGLSAALKATGGFVMTDINGFSHSKWRCRYYNSVCPEILTQKIYGKIKADIREILKKLCD